MSFIKCSECELPPRDLGCVPACGVVELPLYAPKDGDYIFKYWKGGALIQKIINITGAPVRFNIEEVFSENAVTLFQIIDPDGYVFKYSVLRDRLGVKDIQNFDSGDCCDVCQTVFKIRTVFNFSLVDDPDVTINDPCE